ncbi:hypothetical protein GCM10028777_10730 [Angustibacter speluncae]
MAQARRRHAARPLPRRRDPRRLGALLVLVGLAGLGAVAGPVSGPDVALASGQQAAVGAAAVPQERLAPRRVSRDQARASVVQAAADAPVAAVSAPLAVPGSTPGYAQDETAVVADPARGAAVLARLDRGARVDLTGRTEAGFAEIVVNGVTAWVRAADTGANPPPAEVEEAAGDTVVARGSVPQGVSGEPCPGGSAVESGLRASTITTYRAVCAAFPGLSYGGLRPGDDGEHGTGEALDIMVDRATGDRVAAYLQENAGRLGVDNVIWRQRIWFVGDPFTQWKAMADRGSPTANHYDHVHVGTR